MTQQRETPPTRWFSLRRRLLALLLGGVTLGWAVSLALSYHDAHHEIDEIFDANLVQVAQMLLALASEFDGDDDIARLPADVHRYQKKIAFQLWSREGHLLLRSKYAPTAPLTREPGFSEALGANQSLWRYFTQWDEERELLAVVGENHEGRQELAGHIVGRLLVPALLGLPLLATWIWFATRRALAPIDAIADQVQRREPQHLAPLIPPSAPVEIRPLLVALNGLLARVDLALEGERRFTADAAHELRTPLAALTVQASVAARARDSAERDHALAELTRGTKRASHLVEQLLTLARLDPNLGMARSPVRMGELAAEVCADQAGLALAKGIQLELDAGDPVDVPGNADLLRILLRNLVDNALRYSPPDGQVLIELKSLAGKVRLSVSDNGPGIPAVQRIQALERFHRLVGQEVEGSGLGLSIVARIAEQHGARLELTDGLARGTGGWGLGVVVIFETSS